MILYCKNRDYACFGRGAFLYSNWGPHFWGQIFNIENSTNSHHGNSNPDFQACRCSHKYSKFPEVRNLKSFDRVCINPWASHFCFPWQPLRKKNVYHDFFLWHFCPSFPNPFCEEGQENMKITIVQILPTEAAGVGSWRGIAFKTEVAEALIWRERLHNCVATAAWRNTGAHIAQIDGLEN